MTSSPPPAAASATHEGAPLDRRVFDSWADFDAYMETYARRTFQLFRKRTSTSVKLRNRRVADRRAADAKKPQPLAAASAPRLIPERYANYSLTLVCTHSGAYVSRGTGRRSRQDVRATHCHVQVNACLKLADPVANRYQVTVTRALLTHNHRVDQATFLQYSNTRLKLSHELLSGVELMRQTGVKPKDVRKYIMEHSSCVPTPKDVQNILHRLRSQEDAARAATAATATAVVGAAPTATAVHAELKQMHDGQEVKNENGSTEALVPSSEKEVLQDYRVASAAALADSDVPHVVDAPTQSQVARAMGNAVATLLADLPAAEFAAAIRVIEVAAHIVRDRGEDRRAAAGTEASEDTATTGVNVGGSCDTSWVRGL
ncbi:unnamed protein product [Hyaloperonospora brassicae]|uniref:FAR1 domain-containing protein n=1 Tax=Hyaloperonospora brassicae TaxID=162125 RepID=A0AAV0V3Y6_HYABA|nr:unnamed protein product [Hyaloperonospora brassicae]